MKLTKTKLKQIVKEELRSVLYEWPGNRDDDSREESHELDAWDRLMQKVDVLEDMVWSLVRKISGPPMTDEERAEWAKNIQGELPPVRESKKTFDKS